MSRNLILAVDQGSSSTRCLAFDENLTCIVRATRPVKTHQSEPGWFVHDPLELVAGVTQTLRDALLKANATWRDVASIGLATQMETFVVWDPCTGDPLTEAISWQSQRGHSVIDRLRADGTDALVVDRTCLNLSTTFPAIKLRWLADHDPNLNQRLRTGRAAIGDIASWLVYRLSGQQHHVTEPSNACRTLLFDLQAGEWDPELLSLFGVHRRCLPEIRLSDHINVTTDPAILGDAIPIQATLGDQPAALYGQGGATAGRTALTLGTGAFTWKNAGPTLPAPRQGVLRCLAAATKPEGPTFAYEAFAANSGNVIDWLGRNKLTPPGWRPDASALELNGPIMIAAVAGLGTPTWHPSQTLSTAHIAANQPLDAQLPGAAMRGVLHQVVDALESVQPSLGPVRVGGGMAANQHLLQALSDASGLPLEVPEELEVTALGIAWMCAQADNPTIKLPTTYQRRYTPVLAATERERCRQAWITLRDIHTEAASQNE